MTNKPIIIDGVDVSKCEYLQYKGCNFPQCLVKIASFDLKCEGYNCHFKRLVQKEQECEELHSRTASIIYSLTGGRLSYSTYTLEGCEQAYHDQLEIDVERATKELQEELQAKEQECKNLEEEIRGCRIGIKNISIENTEICKISEKYKQALDKIEKLIPKFDTSTECDYGDFDCENCSSLDEEIVCGYKLKKIIKGIINKVKEI